MHRKKVALSWPPLSLYIIPIFLTRKWVCLNLSLCLAESAAGAERCSAVPSLESDAEWNLVRVTPDTGIHQRSYSSHIKFISGVGIAQWLERRTHDWKVAGSNPCWSGGIIFLLQGWLSVLTLILVSVPPPVLPQQHIKDPGHSAKSAGGRLQLNMHTPYICGFAWSDMEHGCMVYTGLAPRRLQFHVAPAMPAL